MKPPLDPLSADVGDMTTPQLRRLLVLASGASSRLSEVTDLDEVRRDLARALEDAGEAPGDLLHVVTDPATTVTALRAVKGLAKRLLDRTAGSRPGASARFLYHAAVAAAFGRHGISISTQPMANRRLLYERLALAHAGSPVGAVFGEAARRADDRT